MDWQFNGLPLHILIVHFTVIVIPLAALCTVLAAAWPAARRRLGIVTPVVALTALASVPIASEAGEWLEERVAETQLVELHIEIAEVLLPWAIALFVVGLAQWAWYRFAVPNRSAGGPSRTMRRVVTVALAVAVATAAVGSSVAVFVVGESGAKASWDCRVSSGGN